MRNTQRGIAGQTRGSCEGDDLALAYSGKGGGAVRQERFEAILSDVRGRDILNAGCIGHVLPTTEDERGHWLHMRLMRQFADAEILGLDIDQANINCMRALGMNTELVTLSTLATMQISTGSFLVRSSSTWRIPGAVSRGVVERSNRAVVSLFPRPTFSALCKY